jgi:hypothetical protein
VRAALQVWNKGVCSDTFHPRFACPDMRARLAGGDASAPLLLSVGRLSHEKNLTFLKVGKAGSGAQGACRLGVCCMCGALSEGRLVAEGSLVPAAYGQAPGAGLRW